MVAYRSTELLASLPREVAEQLRPHTGRIAAAIIREVQRTVPAYAQPIEGTFGKVLVQSVEQAVIHCIDRVGNPDVAHDPWVDFFRDRGRIEYRERRNMDALQAAARVGGRAAWRYISALMDQLAEISPDFVALGAEGIFAYVDELSAAAVEGYHEAQREDVGPGDRRRRALLELIVTDAEASPQTLASMAEAAEWPLPDRAAIVALEAAADAPEFPVELLDTDVLINLEAGEPYLLSTDPKPQLDALTGRWTGWRAAVSPTVPLSDAPAALRTARRALRLITDAGTGSPVIWCQDHLATLWLLAEDFFGAEVAKRSLDPFDSLSEKQRDRLSETLLAWLETRGGAPEIAKRLQVHPQTVRARLHQLKDLFGDRLDDADDRLGMHLALRAQQLIRAAERREAEDDQ
ncbi:helix-turn-helix domain-containing protein [Amycolatopsis cihanbeyliensis]|uniref:PucR-like helix-turn-helix protein n=1 Tax=Amycolatopsis cihanbeyliensis TaxID=1128664 RepID=A0A542DQZ1_AMYCI|nr:helix-turn-helix domain-containing protein [Amycolatopsis cihanbeyliensis]TQJ05523.1 PucR-like helix-turn-helix protein [Amycolatopsis cihanbeyliensis]